MTDSPSLSVVTPVYNGAKFLAECIESVLSQTWRDFEYVILDNASTDDTNAIASRYAREDSRIRLVRNERTLPVIENWNAAVALMSDSVAQMKILHADDTLYPSCLERMLDVAARNPSVGIVGSLRQRGEAIVECTGLPAGRELFPGKEIARLFLAGEVFGFAPTSGMVRADLVRARSPFYPTKYLHADLAAYFDMLDGCDFGFIDEVLCFSRTHADSITTTVAERRRTLLREWLVMLREYGPRYFPDDELAALETAFLQRYYRILVRNAVTRPAGGFMAFHLEGLREMGRTPGPLDIGRAVVAELGASVAHPGKLVRHLRDSLARR
jgi:glycosyltransferase involved in cell wall biosynthesis